LEFARRENRATIITFSESSGMLISRTPMAACLWMLLIGGSGAGAAPPPAGRPETVKSAAWTELRGPTGQGHSSATGLPLTWSDTENVKWKSGMSGKGWSSPVIQGDQIWLTTEAADRKTLSAICLSRETGERLHELVVAAPLELGAVHEKNTLASPTPVIDGDRVYVHFGPYGTACLSTDGKMKWQTVLPHQQLYGPSSSPVVYGDLLIVPCLGTDFQYLAALDVQSGALRWKHSFKGRNAESTPLIVHASDDLPQLISNQADRVVALDPRTGDELWFVRQENFAQVPRPVFGHGLVFACGGYFKPEVWAIRPDGTGDVTDSHVVWRTSKAAPLNPSPLLVGDEFYCVSDDGVASCLDARTGELHWRERLGGAFTASPLFADGRLYFLNESGVTTVLAPGPVFKRLATNTVTGRTLASLSVAGRAIYLRTDAHLFRLEEP
jgi:outer membrane protein assembly factor BamB